jgi:hypothetical protein
MKKLLFILFALFVALACLDAEAHAGGGGGGGGKGGSAPSVPAAPPPPAPTPIPDTTPQEATSKAVRDEERRKLNQKKGVGGTMLAPLGQASAGSQGGNTLLGRIGQ